MIHASASLRQSRRPSATGGSAPPTPRRDLTLYEKQCRQPGGEVLTYAKSVGYALRSVHDPHVLLVREELSQYRSLVVANPVVESDFGDDLSGRGGRDPGGRSRGGEHHPAR